MGNRGVFNLFRLLGYKKADKAWRRFRDFLSGRW